MMTLLFFNEILSRNCHNYIVKVIMYDDCEKKVWRLHSQIQEHSEQEEHSIHLVSIFRKISKALEVFFAELLIISLFVSLIGQTFAVAFRPAQPYLKSPVGTQGYSCVISGSQVQLTFENEAVMKQYLKPGQQFTCSDLNTGRTSYFRLSKHMYSELMNDYTGEFGFVDGKWLIVFEFTLTY